MSTFNTEHTMQDSPLQEESVVEKNTLQEKKIHPFLELLQFACIALLIVVPVRYFIAQPFIVSGA